MLLSWVPVMGLFSGLTVETASPDALCPDVASAEAAIHARVGELEGATRAWRVRYTMVHEPEGTSGDVVRLEIYDSGNERRLSRDLPLTAESCATLAQAMALVVERFFRAMVGEVDVEVPGEIEIEPKLEPEPALTAPPSAPVEPDRGVREPAPSQSARPPALFLGAQVGVMGLPLRPTFGPLFVVRGERPFSLAASLGFVLVPWTEELERGGRAHVQAGLLRLVPAWDFTLVNARIALGPSLSVIAERAWTTGLPESADQYRPVFAAGGALSLRVAVGGGSALDITALVEAPFTPFGGAFMVDDEEVLEPPAIRSALALAWGAAWGG